MLCASSSRTVCSHLLEFPPRRTQRKDIGIDMLHTRVLRKVSLQHLGLHPIKVVRVLLGRLPEIPSSACPPHTTGATASGWSQPCALNGCPDDPQAHPVIRHHVAHDSAAAAAAVGPVPRCGRMAHSSARLRHAAPSAAPSPAPLRSSYQGQQTIDVVAELSDAQRQLIVSEVVLTSSYSELKALIMKRPAEMQGEVAAYALLQAANLRGTVELEALANLNMEQATGLMDAQEYVRGADCCQCLVWAHLQTPPSPDQALFSHLFPQIMSELVPAVEQNISSYPPSTQITLVSALAQLGHYNESRCPLLET